VDLTPLRRKTLLRYRASKDRPVTMGRILAPALPHLLIMLALVTLAATSLPIGFTLFTGGMVVGRVFGVLRMAWQARQVMPAFLQVIDWDKVDQLLGDVGQATDAP